MRHWYLAILLVFVGTIGTFAQQIEIPRDYAVINPLVEFSPDQTTFTVKFTVRNSGGAKPEESAIRIINLLDNTLISDDTLPSIPSGGSVTVQVPFTTSFFPAGQVPLQIEVGIDAIEPADSAIADNNTVRISVTIPSGFSTPTATDGQVTDPSEPYLVYGTEGVTVFGYYLPYEPIIFIGVALIIAIVLLWIVSIIFRAIFRGSPEFNSWQPSYANMPLLDPNSTEGRRQAWQAHAQNSLILALPTQGNLHAIKVLLGTDGATLANWKITGVRISQYDNYGRVSRSQLIAPAKIIKQLNNLLKRRQRVTNPNQLQKPLNRIVRGLVNQFKRNIPAKTAFLPIALDLRLEGKHGEIRIMFELYQAQAGVWYRLDQWEPAMAISTRTIQESFTFTIHGMNPSEKLKDYHARLVEDTTWLLTEMLRLRPMQPQPEQPTYTVPDTLTGMKPITP